MAKTKIVSSSNLLNKRKRNLQDYFDYQQNPIMTPNQRSAPKDKKLFHNTKIRGKSGQKHPKKTINPHPKNKQNGTPPHRHQKSFYKQSRFEHSINKQYDSPNFIFKGNKKIKGSALAGTTVQKVNEYLKNNKLSQAIDILKQALRVEPDNFDLIYLLGICYIFNFKFEEAIDIFENMLQEKPRKNIYLLLSVCYKRTQRYRQTENILNECIKKFSKYYEAYIYRGKLFLKLKQFKNAYYDFEKAVTLDSQKQIGYIGKGDCLRLMEKFEEAKHFYTHAYNAKKSNTSLLLRRAICNMELKKLDLALNDIEKLLETDQQNSEALYFKGLIFNKMKQHNEAIICYEQAIKFNSNKRAITRSIYEIAKLKIEMRDYYQALYTLQRAQYLDIDEKVIKKFKLLTDGVTSLMKKNYAEGTKILTELMEDNERPLSNFIKPLVYSTRAYGYLSLEKYQNAKEDIQMMESQFSLDLPNLYNKFIAEGIIACNNQKYEHALSLFSKAGKALPYRSQPPYYKAVTLVCFTTRLIPKQMKEKKKEYLESAMKTISKVETIENNPSLYMIRGLLHFTLGELDEALKDLDKCWGQSTKPNPLVFYLIGLIFAESGKYGQALQEFKRVIDQDEKHQLPEAYLNRAKCMLLSGEVNSAFVDLQSYMSFRPSSPQIHIWAGHLLFYIEAYEDAIKAYSNINNIAKNFEILSYRAKCYLIIKDVIATITNLKLMLEIKFDSHTYFDFQMLEALRQCSDENPEGYSKMRQSIQKCKEKTSEEQSKFGHIFLESDYQFYKGVLNFFDNNFQQASKNFQSSLDFVIENFNNEEEQKQFYRLSNNNRTFNYYEIMHNIGISQIKHGNLPKASKIFSILIDKLPRGETRQIFEEFLKTLNQEKSNPFKKGNGKKENNRENEIMPFTYQNRLCCIFPEVILEFATPMKTRLSFCLPHVSKPDISPKFDDKIFEEFNMSSIEIKPQAPWIKRSEQGVIFTDQVIKYDIELSQSSSSKSSKSEQQQEEQADDDDDYGGSNGDNYHHQSFEEEEVIRPKNPAQLRELFKLDRDTEERLAKLKNK